MIDITELLLIIVVTVITIILTLIGIQVYYTFKELRLTLIKTNKILDDTGKVSETVAGGVENISEIAGKMQNALSMLSFLKRRKHV